MAKNKDISPIEAEAKTDIERHIVEARCRSSRLLNYATKLHSYLHGGAGDPSYAESAFAEADAIRHAMARSIGARLARIEIERKAKKTKARPRKKKR